MLLTVRVAVTAVVPVMAGGAVTVQVGRYCAPLGLDVTAQESATVPVYPPVGVTVMFEVAEAPGASLAIATPLREKPAVGGATPLTVSATVVVCVMVPETPVTVTV